MTTMLRGWKEIAAHVHRSERGIWTLARHHAMPYRRIGRLGRVEISAVELDRWYAALTERQITDSGEPRTMRVPNSPGFEAEPAQG